MENEQYLERLPFGSEPDVKEAEYCPECRALPGQLHLPGCVVERCPKCGKAAIYCECGGISPEDKKLLFLGVVGKMERCIAAIDTVHSEEA